jgi:REP element-mobilizing transposase RayT
MMPRMTSSARALRTHHRRSIRLPGYDYALPGAYFVTVCTHGHSGVFGEIINGDMRANDVGSMIIDWWKELGHKFRLDLDAFVLMPDHVHGILMILGEDQECAERTYDGPLGDIARAAPQAASLAEIVAWFKTMTTNEYIRGVRAGRWSPFERRLWQRNYFERIIRNDAELDRIRQYIIANPRNAHAGHDEDDIRAALSG